MRLVFNTLSLSIICVGATFCLAGCGGPEGPTAIPVAGTVTHADKPVATGQIHFADDEKGYIFPATITNGAYSVTTQFGAGLPAGTYKVMVTPPPPASIANPTSPADVAPTPEAKDIPEKYRDVSTSGLTAEVKEGSGKFDFELKE